MFEVVDLIQGSKEWLEYRLNHVTGTDAGKILQAVPLSWGTPYTLWVDKIMKREKPVNDAMLRGIYLEPFARTAYCDVKQIDMHPTVVKSCENPFMIASLDGLSKDLSMAVEFKCGEGAYNKARKRIIPEYYMSQMQHALAILGHETMDYACFWNDDLIIIPVERDDEYIKNLVDKEREFYDCLVSFTPPEEIQVYEDLVSEDAKYLKLNLEAAIKKKKELEKIIAEHKDSLIKIADGRNVQLDNMKIRKKIMKGKIQYSEIHEIQSIDLEKYRSASTEYYAITF